MMAWEKTAIWVAAGLLAFSLYRLALLASQWSLFAKLRPPRIVRALLAGVRFDLSILMTFLALPVVMVLLPFRFAATSAWWQTWGWLAFAVEQLLLLVLLGDLLYFPSVARHLAGELLLLGNDKADMLRLAWRGYMLPLLVYAVFLLATGWLWRLLLAVPLRPTPAAPLVFAGLVVLVFFAIRSTPKGKSLNVIDAFRSGDQTYGNLVLNGAFSAFHAARAMARGTRRSFYPSEETRRHGALTRLEVRDAEYPLTARLDGVGHNRRNVVFMALESWSNKYVDAFRSDGEPLGLTPNLDRLAADGLMFTRAYASGQRSIHAIQASLTGVPALPGMPFLGKGLEVMRISQVGHLLRRHGYESVFVQASKRRSFRIDSIARSCGFGDYFGWEDIPLRLDYPDPSAALFGWDYETYFHLLDRLNQMHEPFFGYLFTGTTHLPYPNPGERFLKRPHDVRGEGGFLNALHYGDWSLGEFFSAAREQPWFANTTFILTADHPLGFFRSGRFLENFAVPIVLYAPDSIAPRHDDTVVSHCDLMPTILELAGVEEPYAALGESLLRKRRSWAMVEMGSVVGWVDERGYLSHTLEQRLEAGDFGGNPLSAEVTDDMEADLLATAQLCLDLVNGNRWVRP